VDGYLPEGSAGPTSSQPCDARMVGFRLSLP
jgi:hypothetical protein